MSRGAHHGGSDGIFGFWCNSFGNSPCSALSHRPQLRIMSHDRLTVSCGWWHLHNSKRPPPAEALQVGSPAIPKCPSQLSYSCPRKSLLQKASKGHQYIYWGVRLCPASSAQSRSHGLHFSDRADANEFPAPFAPSSGRQWPCPRE